jgi:hypothetical protein
MQKIITRGKKNFTAEKFIFHGRKYFFSQQEFFFHSRKLNCRPSWQVEHRHTVYEFYKL